MSKSEISLRVASLNTQLRFQRHRTALNEAYKLRTYIQLSGSRSQDANRALWRAERVIDLLEGEKSSIIQDYFRSIVNTLKASMNPEDLSNERTLLDQIDREEDTDRLEEEIASRAALAKSAPDSAGTDPIAPGEQPASTVAGSAEQKPDGWSAANDEVSKPPPPPPKFGATRYDPEETDPDYGW